MFKNNPAFKAVSIIFIAMLVVSCVTETVERPAMKFSDAAVISVHDPDIFIAKGTTIAWLPEAVRFYNDKRLQNAPIKLLIEKEIAKNLLTKQMVHVESVNGAKYSIAYTAALASSLDDSAIIRQFGLMPGNNRIPQGDASVEKGSLIIYVFDNKSGDMVWRSAAQMGVKFDMPADERQARVALVIAEMFQTFPAVE